MNFTPSRSSFHFALALLATIGAAGCSSEDGGSTAAKGSAPSIANLNLTTNTIPVGKMTVVTGTVEFDDADGDFDAIEGQLLFGGQSAAVPKYAATTNGQKKGTLNLAFQVGAAQAGSGELELWGVDKNGNTSNRQKVAIEAK